jgi:hypothetical protein
MRFEDIQKFSNYMREFEIYSRLYRMRGPSDAIEIGEKREVRLNGGGVRVGLLDGGYRMEFSPLFSMEHDLTDESNFVDLYKIAIEDHPDSFNIEAEIERSCAIIERQERSLTFVASQTTKDHIEKELGISLGFPVYQKRPISLKGIDVPEPCTHAEVMAATILSIAPGAELLSVRILPDSKEGGDAVKSLRKGLEFLVDNQCDIINLSLQGKGIHREKALDAYLSWASCVESRFLCISAGNMNEEGEGQVSTSIPYPANIPNMTTIGAVEPSCPGRFKLAYGSGRGGPDCEKPDYVAVGPNTSFATALTSGTLAVLWSLARLMGKRNDRAALKEDVQTALYRGLMNRDSLENYDKISHGHGLLNLAKSVRIHHTQYKDRLVPEEPSEEEEGQRNNVSYWIPLCAILSTLFFLLFYFFGGVSIKEIFTSELPVSTSISDSLAILSDSLNLPLVEEKERTESTSGTVVTLPDSTHFSLIERKQETGKTELKDTSKAESLPLPPESEQKRVNEFLSQLAELQSSFQPDSIGQWDSNYLFTKVKKYNRELMEFEIIRKGNRSETDILDKVQLIVKNKKETRQSIVCGCAERSISAGNQGIYKEIARMVDSRQREQECWELFP